jgi:hypothetical protein
MVASRSASGVALLPFQALGLISPGKSCGFPARLPDAARHEIPVTAPGETVVDLPAGSRWRASVRGDGFWSEDLEVSAPAPAERLVLRVYPAGSLAVRLELPAGEAPIESAVVRFRPAALGAAPEGSTTCPVGSAVLRCMLPRGALELHVDLGPRFAMLDVRWTEVRPSATADFGTLRVERALSVTGRVEAESGAVLPTGAAVELQRTWVNAVSNEASLARMREVLRWSTSPDAGGGFRFTRLAPGWYVLKATAPGFAAAYAGAFELKPAAAGSGPEERHLILRRPAEVRVAISPPLDPLGRPWHVGLRDPLADLAADDGRSRDADATGLWSQAGLAPGMYRLSVTAGTPCNGAWCRSTVSVWADRTVEVKIGAPPVVLEFHGVEVEGRLLRAGEPVAGALMLTTAGGLRVDLASGEDGSFRATLPAEEKFLMALCASAGANSCAWRTLSAAALDHVVERN